MSIVRKGVRVALGLKQVRVRNRRTAYPHFHSRVDRRFDNSQFPTNNFTVNTDVAVVKGCNNGLSNEDAAANVGRSRRFRRVVISKVTAKLGWVSVATPSQFLGLSMRFAVNRAFAGRQARVRTRVANRLLNGECVDKSQGRAGAVTIQHNKGRQVSRRDDEVTRDEFFALGLGTLFSVVSILLGV